MRRWATWSLAAAALALAVAFVAAPVRLVVDGAGGRFRDQDEIRGALGTAFAAAWAPGRDGSSAALDDLAAYWTRYHLVKAVLAALLILVVVALGRTLWRELTAGPPSRAAGVRLGGALATVASLGLTAVTLLLANLQGALAPRSSLLSMLPGGSSEPDGLGAAVARLREGVAVAAGVRSGRSSGVGSGASSGVGSGTSSGVGSGTSSGLDTARLVPAEVAAMVDDFARYHAAFAVMGALLAAVSLWVGLRWWRAGRRLQRTARPIGTLLSLATLGYSAFLLVVAVANVATAVRPAPALLAFLDGG